MKILKP
jgi:large subunit ribosomal protein L18e